ncbi:hypothetical protein RND81_07G133200 [Saponaria officinalis]|uniref:Uncharacterized protein n=1 Tax=Saponaria officinalis TaxID=3572 RepID=A0AAW1JRT4_SAPOF
MSTYNLDGLAARLNYESKYWHILERDIDCLRNENVSANNPYPIPKDANTLIRSSIMSQDHLNYMLTWYVGTIRSKNARFSLSQITPTTSGVEMRVTNKPQGYRWGFVKRMGTGENC